MCSLNGSTSSICRSSHKVTCEICQQQKYNTLYTKTLLLAVGRQWYRRKRLRRCLVIVVVVGSPSLPNHDGSYNHHHSEGNQAVQNDSIVASGRRGATGAAAGLA